MPAQFEHKYSYSCEHTSIILNPDHNRTILQSYHVKLHIGKHLSVRLIIMKCSLY